MIRKIHQFVSVMLAVLLLASFIPLDLSDHEVLCTTHTEAEEHDACHLSIYHATDIDHQCDHDHLSEKVFKHDPHKSVLRNDHFTLVRVLEVTAIVQSKDIVPACILAGYISPLSPNLFDRGPPNALSS